MTLMMTHSSFLFCLGVTSLMTLFVTTRTVSPLHVPLRNTFSPGSLISSTWTRSFSSLRVSRSLRVSWTVCVSRMMTFSVRISWGLQLQVLNALTVSNSAKHLHFEVGWIIAHMHPLRLIK